MIVINKIINKIKYIIEYIYIYMYVTFFFDKAKTLKIEQEKFDILNISQEKAETKLNSIIKKTIGRDYNSDLDSIHWKLFSAISLQSNSFNEILEIGTYDGQFTNFLSKMFPKSEITTVDLPQHDPLLNRFYNRSNSDDYQKYIEKQNRNTKLKNIVKLKTNTMFLIEKLKPSQKFDLIWVDGGHLYPEIAWDICIAYNLLNKDGLILCDDVIFSSKDYKTDYVSNESSKVLSYLENRVEGTFTHFLKRTCPKRYARTHSRKYVSILKK